MLHSIQTSNAPAAVGPYSQAIEANGFIFCSGQIGLDPVTNTLVEGIEAQTNQVLTNLKAVLEAAGTTMNHVVKTTVLLKNIADFPNVNEIYAHHFGDHKPARATYAVADLPKAALIEIEAIAIKQ